MVAFRFENEDWGQTKTIGPIKPKTRNENLSDIRFRQLFAGEDWNRLPEAVRNRFGRRVKLGETLIYRGHVEYNRINIWGRALANVLRLIGAPLPLDTNNEGAAAVVTVTEAPSKGLTYGGQIWMRQYARKDAKYPFPQIIQSAKRFTGPTGIEEHIGGGIGMTLLPRVEGEELVFRAEDIFWDIKLFGKTLRLNLLGWMGPTHLRAGHEELGNSTFAFTLKLDHKWFGKMIDQRVWFQDDLERPLEPQA